MVAEPLPDELHRPPHRPGADPRRAPWTLMYHSVDHYEEDPYLLTVTPERFVRQMRWLRRRGLRGVGIAELLAAHAAGRAADLVGLTFDDGYADFETQALPVLRAHGFTASVYVVADRLGRHNTWDPGGPRKRLLTADQVRAVAAAGMEIGSHSLVHTTLTELPADRLTAETARSREVLEEVVGGPVTGFCYPYGTVDQRVADAVRAAGYDYACAIGHSPLTGRYALPRCYVGDRDGGWRLHAKRARHLARSLRAAVRPRGAGGGRG
ncbi:polysaccharide deacetylase family protein [Streptomyces sp. NPDC092296]|uniref:polysaccharide deacetylase family protein n=1 Tax=Streptomyces sp. NPDC092296 TaxID=3366012 RepID=UPI003823C904